jgi:uncharacterized protein (DUF427 family)
VFVGDVYVCTALSARVLAVSGFDPLLYVPVADTSPARLRPSGHVNPNAIVGNEHIFCVDVDHGPAGLIHAIMHSPAKSHFAALSGCLTFFPAADYPKVLQALASAPSRTSGHDNSGDVQFSGVSPVQRVRGDYRVVVGGIEIARAREVATVPALNTQLTHVFYFPPATVDTNCIVERSSQASTFVGEEVFFDIQLPDRVVSDAGRTVRTAAPGFESIVGWMVFNGYDDQDEAARQACEVKSTQKLTRLTRKEMLRHRRVSRLPGETVVVYHGHTICRSLQGLLVRFLDGSDQECYIGIPRSCIPAETLEEATAQSTPDDPLFGPVIFYNVRASHSVARLAAWEYTRIPSGPFERLRGYVLFDPSTENGPSGTALSLSLASSHTLRAQASRAWQHRDTMARVSLFSSVAFELIEQPSAVLIGRHVVARSRRVGLLQRPGDPCRLVCVPLSDVDASIAHIIPQELDGSSGALETPGSETSGLCESPQSPSTSASTRDVLGLRAVYNLSLAGRLPIQNAVWEYPDLQHAPRRLRVLRDMVVFDSSTGAVVEALSAADLDTYPTQLERLHGVWVIKAGNQTLASSCRALRLRITERHCHSDSTWSRGGECTDFVAVPISDVSEQVLAEEADTDGMSSTDAILGPLRFFSVRVGERVLHKCAWQYVDVPVERFAALADYVVFEPDIEQMLQRGQGGRLHQNLTAATHAHVTYLPTKLESLAGSWVIKAHNTTLAVSRRALCLHLGQVDTAKADDSTSDTQEFIAVPIRDVGSGMLLPAERDASTTPDHLLDSVLGPVKFYHVRVEDRTVPYGAWEYTNVADKRFQRLNNCVVFEPDIERMVVAEQSYGTLSLRSGALSHVDALDGVRMDRIPVATLVMVGDVEVAVSDRAWLLFCSPDQKVPHVCVPLRDVYMNHVLKVDVEEPPADILGHRDLYSVGRIDTSVSHSGQPTMCERAAWFYTEAGTFPQHLRVLDGMLIFDQATVRTVDTVQASDVLRSVRLSGLQVLQVGDEVIATSRHAQRFSRRVVPASYHGDVGSQDNTAETASSTIVDSFVGIPVDDVSGDLLQPSSARAPLKDAMFGPVQFFDVKLCDRTVSAGAWTYPSAASAGFPQLAGMIMFEPELYEKDQSQLNARHALSWVRLPGLWKVQAGSEEVTSSDCAFEFTYNVPEDPALSGSFVGIALVDAPRHAMRPSSVMAESSSMFGVVRFYDLVVGERTLAAVAWTYPEASKAGFPFLASVVMFEPEMFVENGNENSNQAPGRASEVRHTEEALTVPEDASRAAGVRTPSPLPVAATVPLLGVERIPGRVAVLVEDQMMAVSSRAFLLGIEDDALPCIAVPLSDARPGALVPAGKREAPHPWLGYMQIYSMFAENGCPVLADQDAAWVYSAPLPCGKLRLNTVVVFNPRSTVFVAFPPGSEQVLRRSEQRTRQPFPSQGVSSSGSVEELKDSVPSLAPEAGTERQTPSPLPERLPSPSPLLLPALVPGASPLPSALRSLSPLPSALKSASPLPSISICRIVETSDDTPLRSLDEQPRPGTPPIDATLAAERSPEPGPTLIMGDAQQREESVELRELPIAAERVSDASSMEESRRASPTHEIFLDPVKVNLGMVNPVKETKTDPGRTASPIAPKTFPEASKAHASKPVLPSIQGKASEFDSAGSQSTSRRRASVVRKAVSDERPEREANPESTPRRRASVVEKPRSEERSDAGAHPESTPRRRASVIEKPRTDERPEDMTPRRQASVAGKPRTEAEAHPVSTPRRRASVIARSDVLAEDASQTGSLNGSKEQKQLGPVSQESLTQRSRVDRRASVDRPAAMERRTSMDRRVVTKSVEELAPLGELRRRRSSILNIPLAELLREQEKKEHEKKPHLTAEEVRAAAVERQNALALNRRKDAEEMLARVRALEAEMRAKREQDEKAMRQSIERAAREREELKQRMLTMAEERRKQQAEEKRREMEQQMAASQAFEAERQRELELVRQRQIEMRTKMSEAARERARLWADEKDAVRLV